MLWMAVCLIVSFTGCTSEEMDYNNPDVALFVKQLKSGTYKMKNEKGVVEVPHFTEEDIPELLKYAEDLTIIPSFPSVYNMNNGKIRLGECMLWVIESIRQGTPPSLGCKMVLANAENYEAIYFLTDEEVLDAAACYRSWWEERQYPKTRWTIDPCRNIGNERVKRMDGLKRVITTMALCLTAVFAYSQVWTAQDSLHLKKLLESDQELHLNMDAVKSIDFGSAVGTPRMSEEKSWMMPDESLPEALPKPKVMLTLMPYKANTRYNWDPIYQKKIKIDKNTWRGDPFYEIRHQRSYSNWARNPMAKGMRKSLDEIQASGVRFRQLGERANGMMVNTVVMDAPIPLFGGSGVYINGGTIGRLDLMAVFTKDFWNKTGRDNRARTLEVLRTYGDSTTVLINKPIEQIAR